MLNILASWGKSWWRDFDRKMFFFSFNVIWDFGSDLRVLGWICIIIIIIIIILIWSIRLERGWILLLLLLLLLFWFGQLGWKEVESESDRLNQRSDRRIVRFLPNQTIQLFFLPQHQNDAVLMSIKSLFHPPSAATPHAAALIGAAHCRQHRATTGRMLLPWRTTKHPHPTPL